MYINKQIDPTQRLNCLHRHVYKLTDKSYTATQALVLHRFRGRHLDESAQPLGGIQVARRLDVVKESLRTLHNLKEEYVKKL